MIKKLKEYKDKIDKIEKAYLELNDSILNIDAMIHSLTLRINSLESENNKLKELIYQLTPVVTDNNIEKNKEKSSQMSIYVNALRDLASGFVSNTTYEKVNNNG